MENRKRVYKTENEVGTQVPLPKELHRELKILSAQTGKTLKEIIPECLSEGVKTYSKKILAA